MTVRGIAGHWTVFIL